jgi:hypothetical protein
MISQISQVHWLSNHAFTGAVNARQARVTPALPWMHVLYIILPSDNGI